LRLAGKAEAVARLDYGQHQIKGGSVLGNHGLQVHCTQQALDLTMTALTGFRVAQHQRVLQYLFERDMLVNEQRVTCGHGDHQRIVPHCHGQNAFDNFTGSGKAGVVEIVVQPLDLLRKRNLEQLDSDIGVLLAAQGEQRRQALRHEAIGQGDAQRTAITRCGGLDIASGLIERRKYAPGIVEQDLTSPGQAGASRIALKEPYIEIGFQFSDGSGQRRLFDVQTLGCAGKV